MLETQTKGAGAFMRKILKNIMIVCAALFLLAGILFTINYVSNERMINRFEDGEYSFNVLSALGILEPYIAPYNEGNVFFEKKNYEQAIRCYEKALTKKPSKPEDCKVRINLALAMTLPIQPEQVNDMNREETIAILDDAIEILCENSCADHEDQSGEQIDGHSKDATELKEDIERLKKELLKDETQSGKDSKQGDGKDPKGNESNEDKKREQELTEQLKEIQNSGQQERMDSLTTPYLDYEFYTGKTW